MKIALIGATGFVGPKILDELLSRGHEVLGISRKNIVSDNPNLTYVAQDILNSNALAETLKGCDIVISAFNPGRPNPNAYHDYLTGAKAILEAVKQSGVSRFITIGGAGSLYAADGVQLVDTPDFPKDFVPEASAARDFLNVLKEETHLDWVFFSPAIEMHPGIKTGKTGNYRLGKDTPVFNDAHRSQLSVEDLAVVIADEVENARHHKERFTAAY